MTTLSNKQFHSIDLSVNTDHNIAPDHLTTCQEIKNFPKLKMSYIEHRVTHAD